jgi:hypothetical protein
VIAHVAGVPVEEIVTALAGAGGGLAAIRAWVGIKARRVRAQCPPWGGGGSAAE